jgi:LysM repeat protein
MDQSGHRAFVLNWPSGVPIVGFMKRLSFFLMIALLAVPMISSAQDAATEERLNKLSAQIDVLIEAKDAQNKKIDALESEVRDLQGKLNAPQGNYASADDLKQVADAVKEVDKKRQADNERVLNELEKLAKTLGSGSGGGRHTSVPTDTPKTTFDPATPHMEHKVESGETLEAIAKAYRDKGIKMTVQQILAANPGLQPKTMKIGQTIIIPAAGQ